MSVRALTDDRATRDKLKGQFFECGSDTLPNLPELTMTRPCNHIDMMEKNVRDRFAYCKNSTLTVILPYRIGAWLTFPLSADAKVEYLCQA